MNQLLCVRSNFCSYDALRLTSFSYTTEKFCVSLNEITYYIEIKSTYFI